MMSQKKVMNFLKKHGHNPVSFILEKYKDGFDYILIGDKHDKSAFTEFVVSIIPEIKKLNKFHIYLELEDKLQNNLDEYFKTGNENFLQKIVERDKELVKRGYPSLFNKRDYLSIIRKAKEFSLRVIAMDDDRDKDKHGLDAIIQRRDKHMFSKIEHSGLIFVGGGHISRFSPKSLSSLLSENKKCFAIDQECNVMKNGSSTYGFTAEIHPHLNNNPVAFDLKDSEVRKFYDNKIKHSAIHKLRPLYMVYDAFIYYPS